jgi:hypothetical protein
VATSYKRVVSPTGPFGCVGGRASGLRLTLAGSQPAVMKLVCFGLVVAFGCAGVAAQQAVPAKAPKLTAFAGQSGQVVVRSSASALKRQIATGSTVPRVPGQLKVGPRIKNPRAVQASAAAIAILQREKQTANLEFARMRVASKALQLNSSAPRSNPPPSPTPTSGAQSQLRNAPEHTQSLGSSSAGRGVRVVPTSTAPCMLAPTAMTIGTVVGAQQGVVLSSDPQYNLYTINGCNLGNSNSGNKAYIYGKNGFHINLQIQFWSPNNIAVNFDPSLSSVTDTDNLFLVLQRADGRQAEKGGFKFYAARQTVLLNRFPQARVRFAPAVDYFGNTSNLPPVTTVYTSPGLAGLSAKVVHTGKWQFHMQPNSADSFAFVGLQPGFQPDSAQLEYESGCSWHSDSKDQYEGNWDISFGADPGVVLNVKWQTTECAYSHWYSTATYGVLVWVTGPRGIDPWTGKPTAK